jgi:hypothetical protein
LALFGLFASSFKFEREEEMKHFYIGLWAAALLALFSIAAPAQAQTTAATRAVHSPRYDASKEITLNATVTSVVEKASAGMVAGSHLMLATHSGVIDASLGSFALRGKDALSFTSGKQVKVTGANMTMRDKEVFVVRTVQMDGHVYNIRNERGFAFKNPGRNTAATRTQTKGGWL